MYSLCCKGSIGSHREIGSNYCQIRQQLNYSAYMTKSIIVIRIKKMLSIAIIKLPFFVLSALFREVRLRSNQPKYVRYKELELVLLLYTIVVFFLRFTVLVGILHPPCKRKFSSTKPRLSSASHTQQPSDRAHPYHPYECCRSPQHEGEQGPSVSNANSPSLIFELHLNRLCLLQL